jgi:hypothetical protein
LTNDATQHETLPEQRGSITVNGDCESTHTSIDILEGPNAIVIITQIDYEGRAFE